MSLRVLVLGGGAVGIATAYCLAKRGCRVTVVEREGGAGLGTSYANGGLITPSMSDPWAAPGLPWKMLQGMAREDSPFLVRPSALPMLFGWGWSFLRHCSERRWRSNTEVIYRLCRYSREALDAISAEAALEFDQTCQGTLRLFRDTLAMANARRGAALVGEYGCRYRTLDPGECAEVEPALAPEIGKLTGGILFPDDASGDAFKFTQGLAAQCARLGVEFRYRTAVQGFIADGHQIAGIQTERERLAADAYVLALGSASAAAVRPLGIKLPLYPVKGYSVTVSVQGWNGAPTVPLVDDGRKMAITRLGDRLRLAGTAEFTGFDTRLNPRRSQVLLDSLKALFPSCPNLSTAQHWAGLRPMTPDGIPIIGATPYANLILNVGHGHLGFTMACGSGRIVADLIAGNPPPTELNGLGLDRWRV